MDEMKYKGYTGTVIQNLDGGYQGRVRGASEKLFYSGVTLESLESAFRASVDDYLARKRRKRFGCLFWLIGLVVFVAALVFTCPDEQAHKDAINNVIKQGIAQQSEDDSSISLNALMRLIGGGIAEYAVDQMLTYDNYALFSLGTFEYQGETKTLSIGLLDHVFTTVSKDDVTDLLKKN